MEYFPRLLTPKESDDLADRIDAGFDQNGFGLWAVEVQDVAPFVGFIGLSIPRFEAHFTPAVETCWRIAAQYWNRGYATEGALAAIEFGFERLDLDEVVSFTVPANLASQRVMEKIGMKHDEADDFDHPLLPAGHPLKQHVLYRISRPELPDAPPRPTTGPVRSD